ncbi:acid type B receptor subunit 1 [Seminavis robusta]|uniref:Acid type B receptor subunit 1 n=1 Tax=Seminavis robusta TaxID=568900 RepID=A0A9N8HSZ3_9STRA|nr:acid type B receptor subunit 1 [Seminavis robusta]|eukprot:Sro1589_g284360.1 acid type B receptor subunit 1 (1423) ;mRNA; f:13809-18179
MKTLLELVYHDVMVVPLLLLVLTCILCVLPCESARVHFACDACIARPDYRLQALVHGRDADPFWRQFRAASLQAAADMKVHLDMPLLPDDIHKNSSLAHAQLARDIRQAVEDDINGARRTDALLVTIPDEAVAKAAWHAVQNGIPVFAFNTGYHLLTEEQKKSRDITFFAQDELLAGQQAALEFVRQLQASSSLLQPLISKALFINHEPGNPSIQLRYQGFGLELKQHNPNVVVEELIVQNPTDIVNTVTSIHDALQGCTQASTSTHQAILLAGTMLLDVTLGALEQHNCVNNDTPSVGVFDTSDLVFSAILQGKLAFATSQQQHLQAVLPVIAGALYATTGKRPTNPMLYTGPYIVTKENMPTDTLQVCQSQGFPVCDQSPDQRDERQPVRMDSVFADKYGNGQPDRLCPCTDRSKIRIGAVLHGTTTNDFWNSIQNSAEQAAIDMNVALDLVRFPPQETNDIKYTKMALAIKTLCESGVDGIFVSIPSDIVVPSIQLCLDLKIPVISTNAGSHTSKQLGLLSHVGQLEFNAGHGGGQRLLQMGMQVGYCLHHIPGHDGLYERCAGFAAALNATDQHGGMIELPQDSDELFVLTVEEVIGKDMGPDNDNWDGVGLLILGSEALSGALQVQARHPGVMLATFDLDDSILPMLEDSRLLFAIDQQPYLQGSLPVHLLAYQAYTKQTLLTTVVETGPSFVTSPPSPNEEFCESTHFEVCKVVDLEDLNYIDPAIIHLGYALLGIIAFMAIGSAFWLWYYQNTSPIVRAGQPRFLFCIALGALISGLAIIPMSMQTDYRNIKNFGTGRIQQEENPSISAADAACMAVPWLYGMGFVLIFSALFAKIYRVKLVYKAGRKMLRRKIGILDVMGLFSLSFVPEVAILLTWQLVSPFRWEREVHLQSSGGMVLESVGGCTSDHGWHFLLALLSFHVLCLFYALVLCIQTKDIPTEFSESNWVSLAVLCIFQVTLLAIPVGAMVLETSSPDAFYFVRVFSIFLQNVTVLSLMFGPKMIKIISKQDGHLTSGQSRISGLGDASSFYTGTRSGYSAYEARKRFDPYARPSGISVSSFQIKSHGIGKTGGERCPAKEEAKAELQPNGTEDVTADVSKRLVGTADQKGSSRKLRLGDKSENPKRRRSTKVSLEDTALVAFSRSLRGSSKVLNLGGAEEDNLGCAGEDSDSDDNISSCFDIEDSSFFDVQGGVRGHFTCPACDLQIEKRRLWSLAETKRRTVGDGRNLSREDADGTRSMHCPQCLVLIERRVVYCVPRDEDNGYADHNHDEQESLLNRKVEYLSKQVSQNDLDVKEIQRKTAELEVREQELESQLHSQVAAQVEKSLASLGWFKRHHEPSDEPEAKASALERTDALLDAYVSSSDDHDDSSSSSSRGDESADEVSNANASEDCTKRNPSSAGGSAVGAILGVDGV